MSSGGRPTTGSALYPAPWRERYAEEVRAVLDDSGADLRTAASLAWQAAIAWAWPPRHLYDSAARMRGSVATVLTAWTMLAGLGLVFTQLTQAQGARPPAHPVVGWSYAVFDGAAAVSVLMVGIGGLPLWVLMMRTALRRHSPADVAYLCSPFVAPAAWLAAVKVIVTLLHRTGGVGTWWFLVLVAAGFVAACGFAAGPAAALRRLRPRGPAVVLAARTAAAATAAMTVAGLASIVAAAGATLWAPQYAGYRDGRPLAVYVLALLLAGAVATVSATRGVRAARRAGDA